MYSLRQRIRESKINCMPWKFYRYEIQRLPISAQCLFAKTGISYDVLEMELKEEGWLFPTENLFEVLAVDDNMKRGIVSCLEIDDEPSFEDDWTEEDYVYFYENL